MAWLETSFLKKMISPFGVDSLSLSRCDVVTLAPSGARVRQQQQLKTLASVLVLVLVWRHLLTKNYSNPPFSKTLVPENKSKEDFITSKDLQY